MKDIKSFKDYMTDGYKPDYFSEYVNNLNPDKLEWFYNQVKEPLEFLVTEAYLYYKFKWIKKRNFDDLSYEIYLESLYNPEGFNFDIIKSNWEDILWNRYKNRILHNINR